MAKKGITENLALTGFGDIFQSTVTTSLTPSIGNASNSNEEIVVQIPITELHPPEFHPFQVNDDADMDRLAKNINLHGVREPGLVRPRTDEKRL